MCSAHFFWMLNEDDVHDFLDPQHEDEINDFEQKFGDPEEAVQERAKIVEVVCWICNNSHGYSRMIKAMCF